MKKAILFITIMVGLLGSFACKTKDTADECNKCRVLPPDQIVTTRIADIEKTFKVWEGTGSEDATDNSYSVASEDRTSNRAEMSDILAFYNMDAGNLIKDKDLVSIVLYATGAVDAKILGKNDVLGAMIYTSTPDQFFVHVFKKAGDAMKLVKELSSETWAVTYNDAYSMSVVFGAQPNIVAWQIGEFKFHAIKKKANNNIGHKIHQYLNISYFNKDGNGNNTLGLVQVLHSTGASCWSPCHIRGRGACVRPDEGEPYCYPGDEPMCAMVTMQPGNNHDWDTDPRHPFLYDFRDNVLGTSAVGDHIQKDFYYCGSILSGKITSTQSMNGFSLIDNYILPIVKRLNSASAATDSSVIFDKSTRDEINAFVADIKTVSADPTFQEILDEVIVNVNYCEGKTVAQIKYELTY